MKRRMLSAIICVMMLVVSMTAQAKQRLVVSSASKGTEYINNGHKYSLDRGTLLTMETMIYIPYNGSLTFVEETSNKEYTIKSIGWATLEEKLDDSNHTVLTQTKDYVKSVLAQVRNKTPKVRIHSDPATVTREKFVNQDVKEDKGPRKPRTKAEAFRDSVLRAHYRIRDSILNNHKQFTDSVLRAYEEVRKKHYEDYAKFVREAWKHFEQEAPVPVPKEEKVMPILAPDADAETASWFGDQLKRLFKKRKKPDPQQADKNPGAPKTATTPKPVEEPKIISKQNVQLEYDTVLSLPDSNDVKQPEPHYKVLNLVENSNDYMAFDLFGTKYRVRIGDNCRFKLPSVNEKDLADAITMLFSRPQFNNMLYDCLQERKNHSLSDWAYYQMLLALTNHFYGADTNEATFVLGFLYSESGYKMRFAHDGSKLYMLVASDYMLYTKPYYYIEGGSYFLLDGNCEGGLHICNKVFQKESTLSLRISAVQDLSENLTVERTITSEKYDDFSFTIKSNMNYIDFYDTYPPSSFNNNFMTRWAMYANTPMEKGIRKQLYPQMREKLAGMSKLEAVQHLLNWVQSGLEYKLDDEIWGWDRAFFGEESLFYPYCDCEDRSILLSHLVRDLLGLDVVLVYYPGHLATAVDFKEEVDGVFYLYDNRKFVVCDPTIYGGYGVGQAAYEEGTTTSLILLDKTDQEF